jgi:hypothetical protein
MLKRDGVDPTSRLVGRAIAPSRPGLYGQARQPQIGPAAAQTAPGPAQEVSAPMQPQPTTAAARAVGAATVAPNTEAAS